MTSQHTTDMYTNGDRKDADDVVLYISSQRPPRPDVEKQMKSDFLSYASSQNRDPQSVICIGINASNEHVRHVAELCSQNKVFIVDQSAALDQKLSKYLNDIMCGDVKGN